MRADRQLAQASAAKDWLWRLQSMHAFHAWSKDPANQPHSSPEQSPMICWLATEHAHRFARPDMYHNENDHDSAEQA